MIAIVFSIWAMAANAATLDFEFSFTGGTADGSPLVTGVVRGLSEGVNAAGSVEITSNTLGYGIGTYTHNSGVFGLGQFTVTSGQMTSWLFTSLGFLNGAPDVTDSTLFLSDTDTSVINSTFSGLTNSPNSIATAGSTRAVFTRLDPAPIPLPASALLLVAGLGGLAMMRRRAA